MFWIRCNVEYRFAVITRCVHIYSVPEQFPFDVSLYVLSYCTNNNCIIILFYCVSICDIVFLCNTAFLIEAFLKSFLSFEKAFRGWISSVSSALV